MADTLWLIPYDSLVMSHSRLATVANGHFDHTFRQIEHVL